MEQASLEAARVPLRTAEACLEVMRIATMAARNGNVQAVTDAGVAGVLAAAAAEGALLNVQINLKSLAEGVDKKGVEADLRRLSTMLRSAVEECRGTVASKLEAP
jgi:glutamate formiminotransferase/formiminotetrahydrofolate cyclodeaminase